VTPEKRDSLPAAGRLAALGMTMLVKEGSTRKSGRQNAQPLL